MAVDRTTEKGASLAVGREMIHDNRNWGYTRGCTVCNNNMTAKQNVYSFCFNCDINQSINQSLEQ